MASNLKELVNGLKTAIAQNNLNKEKLDEAIAVIENLGHKTYDQNKFPSLENAESFDDEVGSTPKTLAEALLWKLGKWQTYKAFVENYKTENLEVSKRGGIVFSAFAKHL